jgi:hypothetical protein
MLTKKKKIFIKKILSKESGHLWTAAFQYNNFLPLLKINRLESSLRPLFTAKLAEKIIKSN